MADPSDLTRTTSSRLINQRNPQDTKKDDPQIFFLELNKNLIPSTNTKHHDLTNSLNPAMPPMNRRSARLTRSALIQSTNTNLLSNDDVSVKSNNNNTNNNNNRRPLLASCESISLLTDSDDDIRPDTESTLLTRQIKPKKQLLPLQKKPPVKLRKTETKDLTKTTSINSPHTQTIQQEHSNLSNQTSSAVENQQSTNYSPSGPQTRSKRLKSNTYQYDDGNHCVDDVSDIDTIIMPSLNRQISQFDQPQFLQHKSDSFNTSSSSTTYSSSSTSPSALTSDTTLPSKATHIPPKSTLTANTSLPPTTSLNKPIPHSSFQPLSSTQHQQQQQQQQQQQPYPLKKNTKSTKASSKQPQPKLLIGTSRALVKGNLFDELDDYQELLRRRADDPTIDYNTMDLTLGDRAVHPRIDPNNNTNDIDKSKGNNALGRNSSRFSDRDNNNDDDHFIYTYDEHGDLIITKKTPEQIELEYKMRKWTSFTGKTNDEIMSDINHHHGFCVPTQLRRIEVVKSELFRTQADEQHYELPTNVDDDIMAMLLKPTTIFDEDYDSDDSTCADDNRCTNITLHDGSNTNNNNDINNNDNNNNNILTKKNHTRPLPKVHGLDWVPDEIICEGHMTNTNPNTTANNTTSTNNNTTSTSKSLAMFAQHSDSISSSNRNNANQINSFKTGKSNNTANNIHATMTRSQEQYVKTFFASQSSQDKYCSLLSSQQEQFSRDCNDDDDDNNNDNPFLQVDDANVLDETNPFLLSPTDTAVVSTSPGDHRDSNYNTQPSSCNNCTQNDTVQVENVQDNKNDDNWNNNNNDDDDDHDGSDLEIIGVTKNLFSDPLIYTAHTRVSCKRLKPLPPILLDTMGFTDEEKLQQSNYPLHAWCDYCYCDVCDAPVANCADWFGQHYFKQGNTALRKEFQEMFNYLFRCGNLPSQQINKTTTAVTTTPTTTTESPDTYPRTQSDNFYIFDKTRNKPKGYLVKGTNQKSILAFFPSKK